MSLADREYMRREPPHEFRPPSHQVVLWLVVAGAVLLLGWLLSGAAYAATSPACAQIPNLACASGTPTTETVNTQWLFSGANVGANPFIFDGATADTNKTTVAVTDPTGTRTFTIPNADSAAATATGLPCGAGNHISNFNATTGVFTCTADTTAAHNLLSATHTDTTAGSPVRGDIVAAIGGTSWTKLAVGTSTQVLHGGTDPAYSAIVATDIGAGTLANVLVWNEVCTASPCTLANTPRTADTLLAFWRTLKLRRVAACGGMGEYTLSGATFTLCDSTGIGTGSDGVQLAYEK